MVVIAMGEVKMKAVNLKTYEQLSRDCKASLTRKKITMEKWVSERAKNIIEKRKRFRKYWKPEN
jgi:hypothetical protein